MIATHGGVGGVGVTMVRTWTKPHERRQAVAECDGVGEEAGGAAISIGEGMDAHPFRMRPGADIEHGIKLVGSQVRIECNSLVQSGKNPREAVGKMVQLGGNQICGTATMAADTDFNGLKARFTPESPDPFIVRHG